MFGLLLDNREHALIELITEKTVRMLDVGDVHITKDEKTLVVIERKTISDFYQSIRDGRYREQKIRLKSFDTVHRVYLIEGQDTPELRGQFPEDYLEQLLIRVSLKDGFKVFRTSDVVKTSEWIKLLYEKIKTQPELYEKQGGGGGEDDYLSRVSVSKKECLTPDICYKLQLKQIPGISSTIAEVLFTIAPNWKQFIDFMTTTGIEGLSAIVVSTTNGKTRKLGVKNAERIFQFVLGYQPSPPPSSKGASKKEK